MWYVSPYKWLVEGVLGQGEYWEQICDAFMLTALVAVGKTQITCSELEYVTLDPPSGSTCSQYLQNFITRAGGYLVNESATTGCQYCSYRTTDEFLGSSFTIKYSHHWRNFGIFVAFTMVNVCDFFFYSLLLCTDFGFFVSDRGGLYLDLPFPYSYLE